jgi:sarcosine oxidase subunit alpha
MGRSAVKDQPNRLSSRARHFAGSAIIRSRPVKFRLNGRSISGFEGDTVLSAVLASGYDAVGTRDGCPLALSLRHAPPVLPLANRDDPNKALPMERTPATDGAQYVTLGAGHLAPLGAAMALIKPSRSLDLDLDDARTMLQPWLDSDGEMGPEADLVVIGGGVAGMTAALAGVKAGLRVTLVESSLSLGGYAGLFGSQEGEEAPDQSIQRLVAAIAQDHTIRVMLGTKALAARPGTVRVHSVGMVNGIPTGRTLDLPTRCIIIATGAIERLPVFPGNRLPGVATTLESYHLAQQFGVWTGKTALFSTVSNSSYRLAMLATDAGVGVSRIMDARTDPQSRFIEFSKAYGITIASGTILGEAKPAPKGRALLVSPRSSLQYPGPVEPPLTADRLVVCGGWQPDLTLWHMAGGESQWNAAGRLDPILKGPVGIALAGSAAGYISHHACLRSGKAAVAQSLNRRSIAVEERLIDPIYETPDDPTPSANSDAETAPAFLDSGLSYIERPQQKRSRWPGWLPFGARQASWSLADMPHSLAIADIVAGTQLGAIPPQSAGVVAQERVASIPIGSRDSLIEKAAAQPPAGIPAYLGGRFGEESSVCRITASDHRRLEMGALIYADADEKDPLKAIGAVMRVDKGETLALFAATARTRNSAFVREGSTPIAVSVEASV